MAVEALLPSSVRLEPFMVASHHHRASYRRRCGRDVVAGPKGLGSTLVDPKQGYRRAPAVILSVILFALTSAIYGIRSSDEGGRIAGMAGIAAMVLLIVGAALVYRDYRRL